MHVTLGKPLKKPKDVDKRTTEVVCRETTRPVQFPLTGQCFKSDRYILHQQDANAHVWATTVINFFIKAVYLYKGALKIVSYTWAL